MVRMKSERSFVIFNLKTQQWTDMTPGIRATLSTG